MCDMWCAEHLHENNRLVAVDSITQKIEICYLYVCVSVCVYVCFICLLSDPSCAPQFFIHQHCWARSVSCTLIYYSSMSPICLMRLHHHFDTGCPSLLWFTAQYFHFGYMQLIFLFKTWTIMAAAAIRTHQKRVWVKQKREKKMPKWKICYEKKKIVFRCEQQKRHWKIGWASSHKPGEWYAFIKNLIFFFFLIQSSTLFAVWLLVFTFPHLAGVETSIAIALSRVMNSKSCFTSSFSWTNYFGKSLKKLFCFTCKIQTKLQKNWFSIRKTVDWSLFSFSSSLWIVNGTKISAVISAYVIMVYWIQ